jgi:hypothetical protein
MLFAKPHGMKFFTVSLVFLSCSVQAAQELVSKADIDVFCEASLERHELSDPALARIQYILQGLRQVGPLTLDPSVTSQAYHDLGLPDSGLEASQIQIRPTFVDPRFFMLEVRDGQSVHLRVPILFPPFYVWRRAADGGLHPVAPEEAGLKEHLQSFNFGFIYGREGPVRRFLVLSDLSQSQIQLSLGVDVPCESIAQFTSHQPLEIVNRNNKSLCRVRVLSAAFRF